MDFITRDLNKWIPRLITAWRAARKDTKGPPDRLHPHEIREVGGAIRRLSQGLTRERELAGARYMEDPKLLGAYLLFYWPVSYAQARHVLKELPGRPRSVLDLGSGPGPVAFAALDAGASDVTAADRSPAALELARALALEAGEGLSTRPWNGQQGDAPPDGNFDLITMGHV
ncbi:MAG: methyltransferase domain-containing protein, partial [Myxococcales bacterium]